MEYVILWLFGIPIFLTVLYYNGEICIASTDEEVVTSWLMSIVWPLTVIVVIFVWVHRALLKLFSLRSR